MKDVDAEYYGYRDEDDGVLLPLEAQYEKQGTSHLSLAPDGEAAPSLVHALVCVWSTVTGLIVL